LQQELLYQKRRTPEGQVSRICRIKEWLMLEGTSGDWQIQPSCSKQGQLEQVAQGHGKSGFKILVY